MRIFYPAALLTLFFILLLSCKKLVQYHPNEVRLEEEDRNLNAKNLVRLNSEPKKASFRFAVIGDSQRFYEELGDLVNKVNTYNDISFVILNGDITDFGLNREYKWIGRELRKLNIPFLAIIGNHDMLANGRVIYQEMFGPENFSFEYNDYKFVCINTNSREVGYNGTLPDTSWLREQVTVENARQEKGIFVFSHIPPTHGDFDPRLSGTYAEILKAGNQVLYSIHAHQHSYSLGQPYGPPVNYVGVGSLNKRSFIIMNVNANTTEVEQVLF